MIALLGLLTGLISTFVAALLSNRLRHRAPVLALAYFAIVIAGLALSMMEYPSLFAFGNLSEAYLSADVDKAATFQASNAVLTGLRDGVHFLDKLLGGLGALVLFVIFCRLRLVPRLIAGFGIRLLQYNYAIAGLGSTLRFNEQWSGSASAATMVWVRVNHDLKYAYDLQLIRSF